MSSDIVVNNAKDSDKLLKNVAFLSNRSPFFKVISRHAILPISSGQCVNFQFNLPANYLIEMLSNQSNNNNVQSRKVLHLRLFDINTNQHCNWGDDIWSLNINGSGIRIDKNKKNKKKGKKRKSFEYIQPLDITSSAINTMYFTMACTKKSFYGAASIEIVELLNGEDIANTIISRSGLALKLQKLYLTDKFTEYDTEKCIICGSVFNLSRCARCKCIWYCSKEHQLKDWNRHNIGCQPYEILKKLTLKNKDPKLSDNNNNNNNNDIQCNEIRISLKDALSLKRINIPIRGINCYHPQCIDLNTYLLFAKNTKSWNCPICMKALIVDDIIVDQAMQNVLNNVNHNIDFVRLNPMDYSFKIITLNEIQKEDNNGNNINQNQKTKTHESNKSMPQIIVLD